jgi:hypothetical protein
MKMTIDIVPAKLRKYVGMRPPIVDPIQRAEHMAFNLITECLAPIESPFVRISRNGVMLCDATEAYLYDPAKKFGFISKPYKRGTRQVLEDYIDSVIKPGMDDAEKAIALSQSMHYDLPARHTKVKPFLYGESDEDTVLKGGGHCSCRGRLLSALCQVLGIPARPAMMWVWTDRAKDPETFLGGHTVAEVFLGGRWGFFDPQHHLYCRTHNGSFRSIAEIRREPALFTDMPKAEVERMQAVGYGEAEAKSGLNTFEYYWHKNFDPRCTISISRHDVNARYEGRWCWATNDFREKQGQEMAALRVFLRGLAERGELTDEVYYMNLNQLRRRFGLTGPLQSFAGETSWEPVPSPKAPRVKRPAAVA